MNTLWLLAAAAMLLVHLVVHEAAHALAVRRLGGTIEEAGLGMPFAPRVVLKATKRRPFRLSLSPWLLGAYVEPTPETVQMLERRRYWDRAWFAGAGVVANLILGTVFMAAVLGIRGSVAGAIVALVAAGALWFARKVITAVAPLLGLGSIGVLAWAIAQDPTANQGPRGMFEVLQTAHGLDSLLALGAAVGVSLAIFNTIPIFPFDGGRVVDAALTRFGPAVVERYRTISTIIAVVLIVYVLVSDWI